VNKGIKELMERIKTDKEFAAAYKDKMDFASFAERAEKDGYAVTARALMAQATGDSSDLSDEELANVAGGNNAYDILYQQVLLGGAR